MQIDMGKTPKRIEDLIDGAIKRASAKNGGDNSLKRDGNKIICSKCTKPVDYKRGTLEARIDDHLKTETHQKNKNKPASTLITVQLAEAKEKESKHDELKNDLTDTFVSCDIPLDKLKRDKMKWFLKKYCTGHKIPDPQTCRNRIQAMAEQKIQKIREEIVMSTFRSMKPMIADQEM